MVKCPDGTGSGRKDLTSTVSQVYVAVGRILDDSSVESLWSYGYNRYSWPGEKFIHWLHIGVPWLTRISNLWREKHSKSSLSTKAIMLIQRKFCRKSFNKKPGHHKINWLSLTKYIAKVCRPRCATSSFIGCDIGRYLLSPRSKCHIRKIGEMRLDIWELSHNMCVASCFTLVWSYLATCIAR